MIDFKYLKLNALLKGTCKVDEFCYRFVPVYDDPTRRIVPQIGYVVGKGNRMLLITDTDLERDKSWAPHKCPGIAEFDIINEHHIHLRCWCQRDCDDASIFFNNIISKYINTNLPLQELLMDSFNTGLISTSYNIDAEVNNINII